MFDFTIQTNCFLTNSGVSAPSFSTAKKESQNHIASAEATLDTRPPPTAAEVAKHKSLRTLEMKLAMNNTIEMGDTDLETYPNLNSILGRDLSLYHR
jgi:hypothetical protein